MAGPRWTTPVGEAPDTTPPGSGPAPGQGWRPRGVPSGLPAGTTVPVTDRVPVRFTGEGRGVEDLSWGQLELWTAILRQENWLPIGAATSLPPGTTVDDVAAELRFLMSRYQTARTRLRFDADGVKQVVADAGEIPLEVVDAEPDADPAAVAEQLWLRYREAEYDFATEWPVRAAVIRHRGVPTHKVLVMCHLVTDAAGARQMVAELADRLRPRSGTGGPVAPPTAIQALAQARWQRSPAGRRVDDAALQHWERLLRTIPSQRFPGSRDPRRPRYWQGGVASPAMRLVVRAVAARMRVATAPILLALYAIALARLTGINPVVVQVVTNNRFRPTFAGTVSPVSQTGLCVIDVAGLTVAEVVAQVRRRTMTAYKYAYYDPRRMDDLVARLGRERGQELDIACYFNDRRQAFQDEDAGLAPPPAPEQVSAALAHTTFGWQKREDRSFEHLFVHIEDVPDRIGITVAGDTHCLAPADMEACVRGMERVAVEAALDPAAPTRVPPA